MDKSKVIKFQFSNFFNTIIKAVIGHKLKPLLFLIKRSTNRTPIKTKK